MRQFIWLWIGTAGASSTESVIELQNIVTPKRALCNIIVEHYFQKKDPELIAMLRPYLERKLEDPWHGKRVEKINVLAESEDTEGIESKEIKRAALSIINAALEDAVKDEALRAQRLQELEQAKFSKKQAILLTTGVGLFTALLGAGVSLAATFASC